MAVQSFLKSRRAKYGSNLAVQVVVLAVILVAVNYIAARHYQRFDWTATGHYTLSEKTAGVVRGLQDDLKITTFLIPDEFDADYGEKVRDLLVSYKALSDKIRVEHFDQHRDPARAEVLAKKYSDTALENAVVFEYQGRVKSVPRSEAAEYDYSGLQYGRPPSLVAFNGEQAFTAAILNVIQEEQTRVYFLTGHGEKDILDDGEEGLAAAKRLLMQENMLVDTLALARADAVPGDCDVLIAAGPTHGLLAQEFDKIKAYLDGGGKMMVLLDPLTASGFETFLASYGLNFEDGVVIDTSQTMLFANAGNVFVTEYGDSEIARILREKGIVTSFYLARPVDIAEVEQAPGLTLKKIAMTTPEGWLETSLEKEVAYDEGEDGAGPVTLAVSVTAPAGGEDEAAGEDRELTMKIAVFGDSDFAVNYGLAQAGNTDLFLNTINWLAEKKEMISIGPKPVRFVNLSVSSAGMKMIFWLAVIGLPALSIILGTAIWYARRQ
jgi:ABC-type uncharacterized transport system involved in gliding motility auxiliary subunit